MQQVVGGKGKIHVLWIRMRARLWQPRRKAPTHVGLEIPSPLAEDGWGEGMPR